MYNLIKNVLISIVVVIFLVLFGFYYVLNSEKIVKDGLIGYVESKSEDVKIESFSLGRSKFIYPVNLSLEEVEVQFTFKGQKGTLSFDNLNIFLKDIFSKEVKNYVFTADNLTLKVLDLTLNGMNIFMNVDISREGDITFSGEIDSSSAQIKDYYLSSIEFAVDFDGQKITAKDFSSNFYGGEIAGIFAISNPPNYDYALQTTLSEISLYELEAANPDIFSYVQAKVNGECEISGNALGIKSLNMNLEAIDGAMMKAALLKQLLSLVSASLGKDITTMMKTDDNRMVQEALDELIQVDGSVPLTDIKIKSVSESNDKINTLISFESDKFNLNIDSLTIDTNIEGGYQSLLRFF